MRPSNLSRGIKRWLNGQMLAADLRPEPRFRGRILVVAPTIYVAILLLSYASLDLLESWEYSWTTPDLGFSFGLLLLGSLINPLIP